MRPGARIRGPVPTPRRYLNPEFYTALRATGRGYGELSALVGMINGNGFSVLVRAESVPAGSVYVERLERLCDAVGFPREQLFLERGDHP